MTCLVPCDLCDVIVTCVDNAQGCMTSLAPVWVIPIKMTAGMGRAMDLPGVCGWVEIDDHHHH